MASNVKFSWIPNIIRNLQKKCYSHRMLSFMPPPLFFKENLESTDIIDTLISKML